MIYAPMMIILTEKLTISLREPIYCPDDLSTFKFHVELFRTFWLCCMILRYGIIILPVQL